MTQPVPHNEWDLDNITELVTHNELERSRIEYKRELGNGNKTLDAVDALANTFGGVVLVGIDEDQPPGPGRITGVDAGDRDRLSRMCWDKLVPPFSPEIIPIKLDHSDRYVLVVIVEPEYARRPVMLTQGNKILVRIEGHNVPADWYRLRDLFTEQPAPLGTGSFTARSIVLDRPPDLTDGQPPLEFGIRGQLWLGGPRGRSCRITEPARKAALDVLNDSSTAITGGVSATVNLMHHWTGRPWGSSRWQLHARNSTKRVHARWQALTDDGLRLAETRLTVELHPAVARSDGLTIQLDTLLANPAASPVVSLGNLGGIMLDTIATLWGPLGETLSIAILGQPLGPPAELAVSLGCLGTAQDRAGLINDIIDFGGAQLILDNTPGRGPIPST